MAVRVALPTPNEDKAEPYRRAIEAAGLEAVTITPDSGESLNAVGLLLIGGTDVDPSLYSALPQPETDQPDRERDKFESALLRDALAREVPVLAICRGLQLLNVVCGGTLIQHLPNTDKHRQKTGGEPVHEVSLDGRMAEVFGASRIRVNSRHHQAVDLPGCGLVVSARDADDGVIEGLVFTGAPFAIGVQWHPENMVTDEFQHRLFESFAAAVALASKRRDLVSPVAAGLR
jgi:putative glutamine amidotransferase